MSVFSVAHELQPVVNTSLDTRGTRAQGTHDVTTPSTPTTTHNKEGHPRYTGAQTGKAAGGPQQLPRRRPQTNDKKTPTSLKTSVLSAKPGVDTLGNLQKASDTRLKCTLHESGEVTENVNESRVNPAFEHLSWTEVLNSTVRLKES